ncbi:MAG TPA: PASTA domain-containing protein, partial [Flavobacteriales bacterium]|nr:PASTA domain-containing protein [Flavobacteriales bacterium]
RVGSKVTKRTILNLLLPVGVAVLLLLGAWVWLNVYTRHDARVTVPDLAGLTADEAAERLASVGLRTEVIDSVYNDEMPKGSVVDQDPDAEQVVKPDRTIYLVMNASEAKMLDMPQLVNLSKRQAISVLDILGIKVKELQYRPDPCVDCVVAQLYKGKPIAAETRIRRGESITLVLGSGTNGERVQVPDVRGMGLAELKAVLNMASLNLGVVAACEGCTTSADTAMARVERQLPEPYRNNMIGAGGVIDVWLTTDTVGLRHPEPVDSTTNDLDDEDN